MKRRTFLISGAALTCAPLATVAAPRAELWERWLAEDPSSATQVDHSPWGALLARYLRPGPVNLFAYGEVTASDKAALEGYLARLSGTAVSDLTRDEQFAFWVNLYNALTIEVVLDHFPIETIRDIDISPGLFADGPWGAKLIKVEDEPVSLDDIEHRILRPIWADPRIHYAVNCASIGCPNLQPEPFNADNKDALLERGAREYVNHPRGAALNGRRLRVSSIYEWFKEDFGGSDAGVIAHLRTYAEGELAEGLAYAREIASDDYDWRLNAATI